MKKNDFMTQKDNICMGILTFIFAVLVFIRIGNTYAPQTTYTTTSENRDIVLEIGRAHV